MNNEIFLFVVAWMYAVAGVYVWVVGTQGMKWWEKVIAIPMCFLWPMFVFWAHKLNERENHRLDAGG